MSAFLFYDEVFASIQGESTDAGKPCVFVRLYGCPIKCLFCDQPQDPKNNQHRTSIANLVSMVRRFRIPYVCVTGGEPLRQWDSVYPFVLELISYGISVSIETSGCLPIEQDSHRNFKYVMDIKCPSSGVSHKNVYDNLMYLYQKDEVKFVISDEKDYKFMKKILRTYPTSAKILLSPCFDKDFKPVIGKELVDWILRDRLTNVRVQIQMHKCLNVK